MGYLFLSIALFAGATKGFCGKKLSGYATNTASSVLLNQIRMILCVIFGILFIFVMGDSSSLVITPQLIIISAISGISTSAFVVIWLLAVRKSAYMMLDVFLMLGTIIPMLLSYFLFSEEIALRQWLGFGVLIVAALLMCSYNNSIKAKLTPYTFLLLILCGVASGATDASQKIFAATLSELPVSIFNLYTYIFAAITLTVFFFVFSRKEKIRFEKSNSGGALVYILIMAIALTANSYFKTTAAYYLESARLYPINQAASLIISTLMAAVFFKEKLTVRAVIGIMLSFVALMLINL